MSKSYPFTLNNYTDEDVEYFKSYKDCHHLYIGAEIAASGTPHLQGYVCWGSSRRWTGVQKLDKAWTRCSMDPYTKGSPSQNRDYCLKGDMSKDEWKAWKVNRDRSDDIWGRNVVIIADHCDIAQGQRTDLDEFHGAIKRGATDDELFEDHLPLLAKYPRLEARLKAHYAKKRTREFRKLKRKTIVGNGGVGKSRKAIYNADNSRGDNYIVPNTENTKWFIDYCGEKTIVINEMGGHRMKYARWKELTDGHQMVIETKGGHTYAEWEQIVMTSNEHPNDWWPSVPKANMNYTEFSRRVGILFEKI